LAHWRVVMSCDGYVPVGKTPVFEVSCYVCGMPVGEGFEHLHKGCVRDRGIPVSVEVENYEDR